MQGYHSPAQSHALTITATVTDAKTLLALLAKYPRPRMLAYVTERQVHVAQMMTMPHSFILGNAQTDTSFDLSGKQIQVRARFEFGRLLAE